MSKQISVVLFDFGGVLADEGFRDGLVALATEQDLDVAAMPAEGMKAVYDSGFVLGRGTAANFWQLMRERTGLEGDDDVLTDRILSGFVIRPWIMEQVQQLHEQGYVTGILSDQTDWLDRLNKKYHFFDAFDHVFNSYYRGKGKQDSSLFTDVATELGLSPAEILFIDDDLGNVTRARDTGMQALQFVDKESFLFELKQLTQKSDK
ncbi:MAG: HAD family phosphatase [Gammaproteobacteria bacterium]|nr:HAD family phosphatase [Gammaproteobacteria bacterium]